MRGWPAPWRALVLAVALACALPVPGAAQTMGRVVSPILTIDRDRLYSDSDFGQRVTRDLEAASSAMAAETRRIEEGLEAEERALTEQRATLDPAAFRELARAFDDKVQRLRREREEAEANLRRQFEAAQSEFFERIGPILGAIVRERGAVLIVDRRAILLAAADVDITEEAIQRSNAILGDGRETMPGQIAPEGDGDGALDLIPAPQPPAAD